MSATKAGLLTLYNSDNYGAMLQGYALQHSIVNNGIDCEIIQQNRFGNSVALKSNYSGLRGFVKGVIKLLRSPLQYYLLPLRKFDKKLKNEKHIEKINCADFRNKFFPKRSKVFYYTNEHIKNDPPQYDIYICGSDMIWSPERFENGEAFYLDFVPEGFSRIAYAPSIASKTIPNELKEQYKKRIEKFQAVSVREKESCAVLSELMGVDIPQALDPAFLLSCDKWNELIKDRQPIDEKVVFCYFLGERNFLKASSEIKKLAKEMHARIAVLPAGRHIVDKTNLFEIEDPGPLAFLQMMRDASFVVTDSFHGTVFSLIYEKQFAVFKAKDTKVDGPFWRMESLLKQFGISNRIFTDGEQLPFKELDYSCMRENLNYEIVNSHNYLKNALKLSKSRVFLKQKLATKESCTGCSACASSCIHNAIGMKKDSAGFWYPHIDTQKCVDCGVCVDHCPLRSDIRVPEILNTKKYYSAFAKNPKIRLQGSSGNVFGLLSSNIMNQDGVVFGAAFRDSNCRELVHQCTDEVAIQMIQKSKYCECAMGDVISQIQSKLSDNRYVLFCGTPCQVLAIRSNVVDNEKLFLCDFICHGVPSINWFRKYIDALEYENKTKVASIDFRDKTLGWFPKWTKITFETGKTQIVSNCSDPYSIDFGRNSHLRKSCYGCNLVLNSGADITIGDYWAGKRYGKIDNSNKGTSLVRINTKKGVQLFDNLKGKELFCQELTENEVKDSFVLRGRNLPRNVDVYPDDFPMNPQLGIKGRMLSIYYDSLIKNIRLAFLKLRFFD